MDLPNRNSTVLVEINSDGSVYAAYDGGRTRLSEYSAIYVPPHGDLIDSTQLVTDLCLDESIEVIARTKLINEYMAEKVEAAQTVIPGEIR